jgi:hypothetical protein
MPLPAVVADPPAHFAPSEIDAPPLDPASGSTRTQGRAWRSVDGATFLVGCVASPIPGWLEDMRPAVEARSLAVAGAATGAAIGTPVGAVRAGDAFDLRSAAAPDGPVLGRARTFLGFEGESVSICFAVCAAQRAGAWDGCRGALAGARLQGGGPAPAPGVALRGVAWAVHHPRHAGGGAAALAAVLAALAIVTRRTPRSRV